MKTLSLCIALLMSNLILPAQNKKSVNSNSAPVITITSPSTNSQFRTGEQIKVTAIGSDADNDIQKVKFYIDDIYVDWDNGASPFIASIGALEGTHILTAKIFDAAGNVTTSSPVTITATTYPVYGLKDIIVEKFYMDTSVS